MAEKLGNGVSRTLSASDRNFGLVVWQKGKPPLDSELNLMAQIDQERLQDLMRSQVHSGFFLDPTEALNDFVTKKEWSNFFVLGEETTEQKPFLWACVNGWLVPVAGTDLLSGIEAMSNAVKLNPPPSSDARTDFIFLEVWSASVAPNPSTENKPSASEIYKFGNVESTTNMADDIQDPTIGYETTERVQIQYRIRVFGEGKGLSAGVALDTFVDGFGDTNILGQGSATSPVGGMSFTNMKEELGDPSLWRAGNGIPTNELGTIDGYVYAIPICAIFRRNSAPFLAIQNTGVAEKNGSFDRNPSADNLANKRQGAKILTSATLTNAITAAQGASSAAVIEIDGLLGSGLDDSGHNYSSGFFIQFGDEIVEATAYDTVASPATITITSRGRYNTQARPHKAGTPVTFFNSRPDGKFADEVHADDILDLRRGINIGGWDYSRMLIHNLRSLVQGTLRSSFKKEGSGGDTVGTNVLEVAFMNANGTTPDPNPTNTVLVDGPDGIRTIWSDSATIQTDITMLCDVSTLGTSVGGVVADFSAGVDTRWDVTPDFKPSGFTLDTTHFVDGTTIFLHIGGDDGNQGARYTFKDSTERKVRFVSPKEMWNVEKPVGKDGFQKPIRLRWIGEPAMIPAAGSEFNYEHLGDMHPTFESGFTKPFIFLGDVLNSNLKLSLNAGNVGNLHNVTAGVGEIDFGIDFDALGSGYYKKNSMGDFVNDPREISNPLLNGTRTLFSMLTDNGRDRSGQSSEVYLILYGDNTSTDFIKNSGAFKVVGVGTAASGFTTNPASTATRMKVEFLTEGVTEFDVSYVGAIPITCEVRSQSCTNLGGTGSANNGTAAATLTFTSIASTASDNPWGVISTSTSAGTSGRTGYDTSMVLVSSLAYNSGRAATPRVPDKILRFSVVQGGTEYLRQPLNATDIQFPPVTGVPEDEIFFKPTHIQVWNRLDSLGLTAPNAPSYGGKILAFSEQDRECEVFFDNGSKTIQFRPFLDRRMTLRSNTITAGKLITQNYLPSNANGGLCDMAQIFETTHTVGFALPPEFMPRFGRQDIPFYNDVTTDGSGTFLTGINHLFTDDVDYNDKAFSIIGGPSNGGSAGVVSMLFQTGATSGFDYGVWGDINGGSQPQYGTDAYQARLFSSKQIISSDFGKGMEGIELPPFLGIARLYGIYDRRDFVATTASSAFEQNRITPIASPPTNLLKTDSDKQTLFIRQGGATDVTGGADDHTYIIPSNLIDITMSPNYTDGEVFSDLEYVVECVVFGFSTGFINKNNYVLARAYDGAGSPQTTAGAPYNLIGCNMTIPAPAPKADKAYTLYQRTVYQGDPYMTRDGSTRYTNDYDSRYGEVTVTNSDKLKIPIEQTDNNGDLLVETPNLRELEVLASIDFYTTLGTGKIGGKLYKGTVLDVAHKKTIGTRKPQTALQVEPRTFTEGQMKNDSRASLSLQVFDNTTLAGTAITFADPSLGAIITLTEGVDWVVAGTAYSTARNIKLAIEANANIPVKVTANFEVLTLISDFVGTRGNATKVGINKLIGLRFYHGAYNPSQKWNSTTHKNMSGGVDLINNAGNGTSQLDLTGMVERLPLGILLQDHDFLCENPLNDMASAFVTMPSGLRPPQTLLPLTDNAEEEGTRFLGVGQSIGMCDGAVLKYEAYDPVTATTGTRKFRVYRGGAAYVLSGDHAGAPIDFYSMALHGSLNPTLKGCVLAGKALLVRNFKEEAFTPQTEGNIVSTGDEIQMAIITYGLVGSETIQEDGLDIQGLISPTGYGEGYAAIDRYRLVGKPMYIGRDRVATGLNVEPSIYPYTTLLDGPDLED